MIEAEIKHIHSDLETLKKDVAELKSILLKGEGELSDWAQERILNFLTEKNKKLISQEEIEKEFSA
ncbi:hypothetical protein HYU21_00040 [Candidatus Woesearchaeota archaeon]|nr:hypothetical protein [Candidatus Woesearchaeota archaeon]